MTLRVFYVLTGLFTALPALMYLCLYRSSTGNIFKTLRHPQWYCPVWLVALQQTVIVFSVFILGARQAFLNLRAMDRPILYDGQFDEATAAITAAVPAVASVVFLFIYLITSNWPAGKEE